MGRNITRRNKMNKNTIKKLQYIGNLKGSSYKDVDIIIKKINKDTTYMNKLVNEIYKNGVEKRKMQKKYDKKYVILANKVLKHMGFKTMVYKKDDK